MNEKAEMIEGVPNMIKKDKCLKSQLIGYGLCTSARIPVAFRNYDAPYFPLSGPAHFGMSLVRGDEKLTTFQFQTKMTTESNGLQGVIEFSTPGALYERKLKGAMLYTDIKDKKVLTLSTERFGKTGSIEFSYNSTSHRTSIEAKNNFVTTKDMVARIVYFNETNTVKEYGIEVSAEYDWYKFLHVTKYMKMEDGPMLESKTEYAPEKNIITSLAYNPAEKKLEALFDMNQFKQSVKLIGKWEYENPLKQLVLTAVHIPTGKTAQLLGTYLAGNDKKEMTISSTVMGKTIKNTLKWFWVENKQSLENTFSIGTKKAIFLTFFDHRSNEKELQFVADVLGKQAVSTVLYTNEGAEKFIDVTVSMLGKKASAKAIITSRTDERSIKIIVDAAGKTTDARIGYYNTKDSATFKIDGKLLGKDAELFWKLENTDGYRSTVGAVFGTYVGGFKTKYTPTNDKHMGLCSDVYYGTSSNTIKSINACVKHTNQDNAAKTHRILEYTIEIPELKQRFSQQKEFTYEDGVINMLIKTTYNGKLLCTKSLDLLYKDPSNSAVTFNVKADKYTAGWKAYTERKNGGSPIDFGLRFSLMEKSLLLLNTYEGGKLSDQMKAKITSSIKINEKALPVTTVIDYLFGNDKAHFSITGNVGNYHLTQTCRAWYGNTKYGIGLENEILNGDKSLYKINIVNIANIIDSKWEFGQQLEIILEKGNYKYGWDVTYEQKSDGVKRVDTFKTRVHYAKNRMSTFTVTFADSTKTASINIDVEYIPQKKVNHFIRYDKKKQQLDVAIEFLPKMFAMFMVRLEKEIGYELITSMNLNWKNYKRVFNMINSYKNNEKEFMLSTNVANDLSIRTRFNKVTPKSLSVDVMAFGNTADFVIEYQNLHLKVKFDANEKNVFKIDTSYDQVTKSVLLYATRGEKVILELKQGYRKIMKALNLPTASDVKKWTGIDVKTKGENTIMKTKYVKVIFSKKDKSLSIQLSPIGSVSIKYIPKSKSISISAKTKTNRLTFIFIADWEKKVAAIKGIFNNAKVRSKTKFGVKVSYVDKSFKVTFYASPEEAANIIMSYIDNTLQMGIQRTSRKKIIDEVSFKYSFMKDICEFTFNWNTDIIKKINNLIRPSVQNTVKNIKGSLSNAWQNTNKLIDISREAKTEILNFINKIDKAFDDFDFGAARDIIGSSTLKALKKLSEVTVKALKSLATVLDKVKAGMPGTVQRLKELMKEIKALNINLNMKGKEINKKAKILMMKGKELAKIGQAMLNVLKIDMHQNLGQIMEIVRMIVTNITDATRPVVAKAFLLLKDFKIRGMRMQDIVNKAIIKGKAYTKMYIKEAVVTWNVLKVESVKKVNELIEKIAIACEKATDYMMKLRVPYTSKSVAHLIETIKVNIIELMKIVKSMDVKALIDVVKVKIMGYKIGDKRISEHLSDVREKLIGLEKQLGTLVGEYQKIMKDLPEIIRQTLHKLLAMSRKFMKSMNMYSNRIEVFMKEMNNFAEPLTNYMKLVKSSISRHFGPLYNHVIIPNIIGILREMKLPTIKTSIIDAPLKMISNFFLPLIRPLIPLYKNLLGQSRNLNIMGYRIGVIYDMQVDILDSNIEQLVTDARIRMIEQVKNLNKMVEKLKTATPEKMIDTSIDTSIRICNEIVSYLNTIYSEREVRATKAFEDVNAVYEKLKVQYKKITSKSIEEVTGEVLDLSSDKIMVTAGELSNVIKQIVAMDISNPTWKAWTDADIMGHLENYGVNEKISIAIKHAKKANLTIIISKTILSIKEFIKASVETSSLKALESFKKLDAVLKYLKSLPQNDYNRWLGEISRFSLNNNKEAVEKLINTIYETSRKRAARAYETLKQISKVDTERIYNEYFASAKRLYDIVVVTSQRIYGELKQPTIAVYNHYKSILVPFIEKQYLIIKNAMIVEYKKMYGELKRTIGQLGMKIGVTINEWDMELRSKVNDMKVYIKTMYGKFMAKYGDMSWQKIADGVEKFIWKMFKRAKKQYKHILKKTIALKVNIEATLLDLYKKTTSEYERQLVALKERYAKLELYFNAKYNELRPKAMAIYKEYSQIVKMEVEKLVNKARVLYANAKVQGTKIYNDYKDKTLRQIYNEIKKFILGNYLKQKMLLKAIADKNYAKVKELVNEAKGRAVANAADLYQKVGNKMRIFVIPELMVEAESIINQTLRNTVIMAKEIIKAYGPHAALVREFVKEYIEIIKKPYFIGKVKELLTMNLPRIKKLIKITGAKLEKNLIELMVAIKKSDKYRTYFDIIEKRLVQLSGIIRNKVNELKTNPTLLQIQMKIVKWIKEIEKLMKEKIGQLKLNPVVTKMKSKVEMTLKKIRELITEYQIRLNPFVEKVTETLQQIIRSSKFTIKALQKELKYDFNTALLIRAIITSVPTYVYDAIEYFANSPEDAFWYGIETWIEAVEGAYSYAKTISTDDIIEEWSRIYRNTVANVKKLINRCTDKWTKETFKRLSKEAQKLLPELVIKYKELKAKGKELFALLKAYSEKNLATFKINLKNIFKALTTWSGKQIEGIYKDWESCACKDILENPLWGELANEVSQHELTELVMEILESVASKIGEMKGTLLKIYGEQKAMLEKKYAVLRVKVMEKLRLIKTTALELYKQAIKRYTWLVKNAYKLFEEITIADMVAYIKNQQKVAMKMLAEAKANFNELRKMYFEQVKVLYAKYDLEVGAMYEKIRGKIVEEYNNKLMPFFQKLSSRVMKYYKEYYPIMVQRFNELIRKYNALKAITQLKYQEITVKAMELYTEYKLMATEEFKTARKTLIKNWMDSSIRSRLVALKKMTIRETIKALEKLTSDIKVYITRTYKGLVINYNRLKTEFNVRIRVMIIQIIAKLRTLEGKLKESIKPVLADVNRIYKQIEPEIRETATFLYKYYALGEKYNMLKDFIIAEIKNIIGLTKRTISKIPSLLPLYAEIYKNALKKSATEFTEKYQELAGVYARDAQYFTRTNTETAKKAAKETTANTLRRIQDGLKYIKSIDIETVTTRVNNYINKINKFFKQINVYITITNKDGKLIIKFDHPGVQQIVINYGSLLRQDIAETIEYLIKNGNEIQKNMNVNLSALKQRVVILMQEIGKVIKRNAGEFGDDFKISYKANKNIYNLLRKMLTSYGDRYNSLDKDIKEMLTQHYRNVMLTIQDVYKKTKDIYLDIVNSPTTKDMLNKITKYLTNYYTILKREYDVILERYQPGTKFYEVLRMKRDSLLKEYKPTIQLRNFFDKFKGESVVYFKAYQQSIGPLLTTWKTELVEYWTRLEDIYTHLNKEYAVERANAYFIQLDELTRNIVRKSVITTLELKRLVIEAIREYSGYLIEKYEQLKTMYPVKEEFQRLVKKLTNFSLGYLESASKSRTKFCNSNPKLCELVNESFELHVRLLRKYGGRIEKHLSVGKAQADRAIRVLNKSVKDKRIEEKYLGEIFFLLIIIIIIIITYSLDFVVLNMCDLNGPLQNMCDLNGPLQVAFSH